MARTKLTTEEMIAVIFDRSERMERAMFGNGQPGLIDRVARVEEQVEQRDRAAARAGGVGAAVMAVVTLLLNRFGVSF